MEAKLPRTHFKGCRRTIPSQFSFPDEVVVLIHERHRRRPILEEFRKRQIYEMRFKIMRTG
jgi:hypothetical protein